MVSTTSKKCLCQMCHCGRHRCPPKKKISTGAKGISEYTNEYVPYKIDPVHSCKPAHKGIDVEGPMASATTHRVDYVPHPLSLQASCKKERHYEPPTEAFNGLSTYAKEYTAKPTKKATAIKPPARKSVSAKFEAEPTYKADYRQWEVEACHQREPAKYEPPTEPFKGMATYTSDYVPYDTKRTASFKPIREYKDSGIPFDGISDYRDAYRYPDVTERTKPIVNKENVQKSTAPMEGQSTQMRDYDWKTGKPSASCKPPVKGLHSDQPFQDATTSRTDYKVWPLAKTKSFPHGSSYEPSKDKLNSDTTYTRDYIPHEGLLKAEAVGPKSKRMVELPPFQGMSDYRDSYRDWKAGPRGPAAGPVSAYHPPTERFDGLSTTKQHYVPHLGCRPAESCKPEQKPVSGDDAFDDGTMYRMEFTAKTREPCVTEQLMSEGSSYVLVHEDENGHQFYAKATTEKICNFDQKPADIAASTPVAVAN